MTSTGSSSRATGWSIWVRRRVGWCQVAVERVQSSVDAPKVVGIDYLDMDHVRGAVFLKKDFPG